MAEEEPKYITPEIEKRQHRRARVVTEVRCEALGREELLLTRDVSTGGLFISATEPFPLNSQVTLSLQLPAGGDRVSARGEIVYSLKGMGMGVQFSELSDAARTALQKFVDESA